MYQTRINEEEGNNEKIQNLQEQIKKASQIKESAFKKMSSRLSAQQ
jgi:hypothetical protein